MADHLIIDLGTGEVTTRARTKADLADARAREAEERARREHAEQRTAALERDLADYRALRPKLARDNATEFTQAELKLIGRMAGWALLRNETGG